VTAPALTVRHLLRAKDLADALRRAARRRDARSRGACLARALQP
jgi:hypothetical protein